MMNDFSNIPFKAVHSGAGFHQGSPRHFSYYEQNEEDFSVALKEPLIFEGLENSPDLYDHLTSRLENPILNSLTEPKKQKFKTKPLPNPRIEKTLQEDIVLEQSPLNALKWPPFRVLQLDFSFSLGLYLLGLAMFSAGFALTTIPPLFFIIAGYGVFHQIYISICRCTIGCTLGEERYNMSLSQRRRGLFILRSLLLIFTGFIFIPLFSILFRRDLLEDYTNLRLEYNI